VTTGGREAPHPHPCGQRGARRSASRRPSGGACDLLGAAWLLSPPRRPAVAQEARSECLPGEQRRDAMSTLARRRARLVRLARPNSDPNSRPRPRRAQPAGLADWALLQAFVKADAGTRTPDPLLTMQKRGTCSRGTQSRLPSRLSRITTRRDGAPDAARYGPIPAVRPQIDLLGSTWRAKQSRNAPFTLSTRRLSSALAIGAG
jgi:hypothetical protein